MFRNYLKTAFRNLQRNKIYSFINVIGLSLGLACSMLIILYVKDEISYDRFHQNVQNIHRVVSQVYNKDGSKKGKDSNSGYFQGPQFTAAVPEIRVLCAGAKRLCKDIKTGTEIHSQDILKVDSSFFLYFLFPLLSGNDYNMFKRSLLHCNYRGLCEKTIWNCQMPWENW